LFFVFLLYHTNWRLCVFSDEKRNLGKCDGGVGVRCAEVRGNGGNLGNVIGWWMVDGSECRLERVENTLKKKWQADGGRIVGA
jgi:hypothetical protein